MLNKVKQNLRIANEIGWLQVGKRGKSSHQGGKAGPSSEKLGFHAPAS